MNSKENRRIICQLFPFYKPPADVIPSKVCAAFKKQVTLLTADPDGVSVTLPTGFHSRSLPDIQYPVNFVFGAIFPGNLPGHHFAIFSEVRFYGNIDLDGLFFCFHRYLCFANRPFCIQPTARTDPQQNPSPCPNLCGHHQS